jgi:ABC-type lipoprotein release transport system permease subunit
MWLTTVKMAWRNLGRNRRRTLITAGAIGFGLAGMLIAHGFNLGLNRHIVVTATRAGLGHAQIHADGYRETRDANRVVDDAPVLLKRLMTRKDVAAAPRAYAVGLAAIGDRASQIEIVGVDPVLEKGVTNWHERLVSGAYPKGPREIAVGQDLADRLEIEPGSRLVLTVTDARTGDMASMLARVSGVLLTSNPMIDSQGGVMPLKTLQSLLGLPNGVHEIVIRFDLRDPSREKIEPLLADLRRPGLEVLGWYDIFPVLEVMKKFEASYMSVLSGILFVVAGLGVVNTMNMSLLERLKEFGIMRAIGTSPRRLAVLITAETATLGAVGALMGVALWLALHALLASVGVSFGEANMMGVGFRTPIYPVIDPAGSVLFTLSFVFLAPLAGLVSAVRAARIEPVRALREE